MDILTDHISKEMNELNLIRCQRIPKRPGSDWRDLPDEKVSTKPYGLDCTFESPGVSGTFYLMANLCFYQLTGQII